MREELSVKVPLEEVVDERVLDVLGSRVRVREWLVSEHGRRRSCLELRLLAPDGTCGDCCLIDVRGHEEAASLLMPAATAFVASNALRIYQRAIGGSRW